MKHPHARLPAVAITAKRLRHEISERAIGDPRHELRPQVDGVLLFAPPDCSRFDRLLEHAREKLSVRRRGLDAEIVRLPVPVAHSGWPEPPEPPEFDDAA